MTTPTTQARVTDTVDPVVGLPTVCPDCDVRGWIDHFTDCDGWLHFRCRACKGPWHRVRPNTESEALT
jgi:hypothetical protein